MDYVQTQHGDYLLSTDPSLVDLDVVHRYLSEESYWAAGRSRDLVERSLANSAIVVGAYAADGAQVGFGRMVTDLATFAWFADVFVLPQHRGHGLGQAITRVAVEHPGVSGIKRQMLATRDAHTLYARFGYESLPNPEFWMARLA